MIRLALALSLLTFVGCGRGDPRAREYLLTEPTVADVAGRYELERGSTLLPIGMPDPPWPDDSPLPQIVLNADGTFDAHGVPERHYEPSSWNVPVLISAHGTWWVGEVGTLDDAGTLRTIWGVNLDVPDRLGVESAHLLDARSPHRLVFVLGDADEGLGMTFVRAD